MLGKGGFGQVFKAYHIKKATYFALKYVKFNDPEELFAIFIEDFILEQVQMIKSTDFLQYYGIYKDSKSPNGYILMMESGLMTISELLKMDVSFKEAEVLYILNCLVSQLLLLQTHGIANRDVKPQNVIIVEDQENKGNFFYKISDFGIGCILDDPSKTSIPCSALDSCTKKYAAPEINEIIENQANSNHETYDPFKADVYSLGLVTLNLLGIQLKDLFHKEFYLKELLRKMLTIDPNKRISLLEIKTYLEKNQKLEKKAPDISHYIRNWPEFKLSQKSAKEKVETYFQYFKAYKEISRYEPMSFYIRECEKLIEKEPTLDKGLLAEVYSDLAWFYYEIESNYVKAQSIFTKGLELKMELYGEESIEIAIAYNIIGLAFNTVKKDNQKAKEYYNKSIAIFLKVCQGENHEELARPYHNLAFLYEENNEYELAEYYHMKSLEIRRRLSGEEHKETAWNYNSIAHFYRDRKDYVKAEEYYEKSMALRMKILGEEHVDCVMSYNSLAYFYWKIKKNYKKAEELFNKSLKVNSVIYGQKHEVTEQSLKVLQALRKEMH